ncbi:rhomboid family intramembrane serine protease [Lewinella sp. 4G2]|uniref:rhomboid family intramembrane serine protease n=1 Tax=Lewinella sp. 4G2 TaxID=1803372 RepID=UPI0007B4656D|nr:rhomboid family intramembrane serine protease [Lewinella sp. 4G2]OAV43792.1 hypothetical protein A3850_004445 [Lewinella sp. 4G2]
MRSITPIVKYLLIANALLFVLILATGENGPLANELVLYYPSTPNFKPWQLVTHAFMHADEFHIAFNMLGLYFFGPVIETRLGAKNFTLLYFASLFGAVAMHFGFVYWNTAGLETALEAFAADPTLETFDAFFRGKDLSGIPYVTKDGSGNIIGRETGASILGDLQNKLAFGDPVDVEGAVRDAKVLMQDELERWILVPMLGASGAVSGVFASFAVFYPNQKVYPLFLPFGFPAWVMVLVVFGVDLVLGVLNITGDNIAHWAHLGGAITGAALAYYFAKTTVPPHIRRLN